MGIVDGDFHWLESNFQIGPVALFPWASKRFSDLAHFGVGIAPRVAQQTPPLFTSQTPHAIACHYLFGPAGVTVRGAVPDQTATSGMYTIANEVWIG
jgi:hypothetical protein